MGIFSVYTDKRKRFPEQKKNQTNPPQMADEIYVRTGNEFSVNNP